MEEAFAADAPAGLNPKEPGPPPLAWSPPGFAPFDYRAARKKPGKTARRQSEPEPEFVADEASGADGGNARSDAESSPDAGNTAGGDAPAVGELACAVDAMNAVPTANGSPRVIVHGIDLANGQGGEGIDLPEFLRGD